MCSAAFLRLMQINECRGAGFARLRRWWTGHAR